MVCRGGGSNFKQTEQRNSSSVRSLNADKDAYEYDEQLDDLFVGVVFVGNVGKQLMMIGKQI